jgi:superfamily II DNA/RNA helicase
MFDQQTIELIQSAPPLEGLDLTGLPKELTRAYSTIVSLRMRLRESMNAEVYEAELGETERRLQAIALTQEALVAVAPGRENRAAAAFVAASAHQLRFSAKRLMATDNAPSYLYADSIAPEVAATVLFLIAGRAADAAQMSRGIRFAEDNTVEDLLRLAIVDLAHGRLSGIVARDFGGVVDGLVDGSNVVGLLWLELLRGIRRLAADLIGEEGLAQEQPNSPEETFAMVREISVEEVAFGDATRVLSTFSGPHHLASLLHNASSDLTAAGVINIQAPPSIPSSEWRGFLKRLARRRPYLWPNHREAIKQGYLSVGTSAVLSFPTGAGKSTLAELKIGTARLAGKKVVFLAPTLALVNQVATDVRGTFPEAEAAMSDEIEPEDLKNISVMTPERCLTLLGFNPDVFKDIGLLVFDECHLMHPREGSTRRSIDAMLCLLAFLRAVPGTEVLLISAMISNAPELAQWIGEITQRPAIPLTLSWKPTRQARGCIVYPLDQIKKLETLIAKEASSSQGSIPAKVKRLLKASPHGMFSLFQTWKTTKEGDYALLDLLGEDVQLDAAKKKVFWKQTANVYLTPNRNAVAAAVAARSGDAGIKTLVFAQTIPFCTSIQKQAQKIMLGRPVQFTEKESRYFELAVLELGDASHSYCIPGALAACHHGALLPVERLLNESLFRRRDGVDVLVATSTLAQGMNLPGQMVVIAGDDRFDVELEKMALLETHELLNAAGRAGRAGEAADGMVVLVPGKVISYDVQSRKITQHWMDLQKIFSNSDQCLELEDPLQPILDRIHAASTIDNPDDAYLLRRLPIKVGEGEESARSMLLSSFGAFKKRRAGDHSWIKERTDSAMAHRQQMTGVDEVVSWEDELAATTGILGGHHIGSIAERLRHTVGEPLGSVQTWVEWGLDWLKENPTALGDVLRPITVQEVFGKKYEGYGTDSNTAVALLAHLRKVFPLWIGGAPLNQLEHALTSEAPKKCDAARDWSLRLASDLANYFGIVTQTFKRMVEAETGMTPNLPLAFAVHGRCVREGFDRPEKLALHQAMGALVPRVAVHRRFDQIEEFLQGGGDYEKWPVLVSRVSKAIGGHGPL